VLKISANPIKAAERAILLVAAAMLVVQMAPAQSTGPAKVIAVTGRVTVLRGPSPYILAEGDFVKPQETVRTGSDGLAQFELSDGSTFAVYPNSEFVFRQNPGDWRSLVDMILGKIRVKIEHPGGVPNHNTVRTPTAVIAVRGTVFDVDVSDTGDTTSVLCEEGQVEVIHLTAPGPSRILQKGESVTVFRNQPLAKAAFDHGDALARVFRGLSDAVDQILLRRASGSVAGTGTTSTSTGDKAPPAPPTSPTAPPAPPPPHN
jgi:hypothetical protein